MLTFAVRRHIGTNFTQASSQLKYIGRKMSTGRLSLNEIEGDLFSAPSNYSLVNCVAADMNMNGGIAVKFRQLFGQIDELKSQKAKSGGVAVLKNEDRYIYYLVTKEHVNAKPTYDSLRSSLEAMKGHMAKNNVHNLAMPRIGCGIDGLEWDEVKSELKNVFGLENVCITVYNFVPK